MTRPFTVDEYDERRASCRNSLVDRGLDALLMFRQESMYYLTGYDTSGYLYFQTLLFLSDGKQTLLTRSADVASARMTSDIADVQVRQEGDDEVGAAEVKRLLEDAGLRGCRIGIELEAVGLTARRGRLLLAALDGFCDVVDASDLVSGLRQIKSNAELALIRTSATITQATLARANAASRAGVPLRSIRAVALAEAVERGADPPTVRWPMAAGREAQLGRYVTGSGDRVISKDDQVTHEIGASYRHYHTVVMNTLVVGQPDPRHAALFGAARSALDSATAATRSGATFGDIHAAYASALSESGASELTLNSCGYPLGATYPPTWVEQPIIGRGGSFVVRPGMVLFLYVLLQDRDEVHAMSLGETILATDGAPEMLTHAPRKLLVN
jgi:Xaa-Pro dipeptidase